MANRNHLKRTVKSKSTIKDLLSYRIHRVSSLMSRSAALQYRRQFNVSLGEWRALALLGAGTTLSLNRLARSADIDKAQMSRIISGLIERKLVAREEEVSRGMAVSLMLTKQGQIRYRQLIDVANKRNEAFLACLTDQERMAFDEALEKLATLSRAWIASEAPAQMPSKESVAED